jgi:hypothetical protein
LKILIKNLYVKDEAYAADDPDVRSVTILERYDSDSDEGSGDEDQHGYVADLGSKFLHIVELVKAGLSYRQVFEVVALTRSKISGARTLFKPVTRQTASSYTRLIAAVALNALSSVLKHSWVLEWHRTKADKLQEFYTAAESKGFSDLAEAPEWWWLTLRILHEHFCLLREAMTAMQGKEYLLDMQ